MARTVIDLDDASLALAQRQLGTKTKRDTINQALVASKVSSFWNQAVAGALLLIAIAFDRWLSLRVARSLQSAEGAHRDL